MIDLFAPKGPSRLGRALCLRITAALMAWIAPATARPAADDPAGGTASHPPRIIVTTDLGADPDDEQSLVRLLVSANEFDIEGLIVSTGCWKKSQANTAMLDKILEAYGKALPNLRVHAKGFPSLEDANHHPIAVVNGDASRRVLELSAAPGSSLMLDAAGSNDPDQNALSYS